MKTLVTPLLFIIISFTTFAQSEPDTLGNIYDDLYKGNKGTITLLSSARIEGYIDYNFHDCSLKFNDDFHYTPADLVAFEYLDNSSGKKRSFISRYVKFEDESLSGTYFVEILDACKNATLLSVNMPMSLKRPAGTRDKLITEYTVVLYFMIDNTMHPYYVRKTKEIDSKRSSLQKIDPSLPQKFMGEKFPVVKKYASKKHLDWTDQNELITILAYYKTL